MEKPYSNFNKYVLLTKPDISAIEFLACYQGPKQDSGGLFKF
jgi:hypothetical protein